MPANQFGLDFTPGIGVFFARRAEVSEGQCAGNIPVSMQNEESLSLSRVTLPSQMGYKKIRHGWVRPF